MSRLAAVSAALEQCEGHGVATPQGTQAFCSTMHAVIATLSIQGHAHLTAAIEAFARCFKAIAKQLAATSAPNKAAVIDVLTSALQHCPHSDAFLAACTSAAPELLSSVKKGHALPRREVGCTSQHDRAAIWQVATALLMDAACAELGGGARSALRVKLVTTQYGSSSDRTGVVPASL